MTYDVHQDMSTSLVSVLDQEVNFSHNFPNIIFRSVQLRCFLRLVTVSDVALSGRAPNPRGAQPRHSEVKGWGEGEGGGEGGERRVRRMLRATTGYDSAEPQYRIVHHDFRSSYRTQHRIAIQSHTTTAIIEVGLRVQSGQIPINIRQCAAL